jgi:hypothetical protein
MNVKSTADPPHVSHEFNRLSGIVNRFPEKYYIFDFSHMSVARCDPPLG